jgi:hypothetical protein
VARWRHAQALARTLAARPDLIVARGPLTRDDRKALREHDLADAEAAIDALVAGSSTGAAPVRQEP